MGLPAILAAAGAAIGGIGALSGAKEASKANATNEKISKRDFEAAQKAREEAIEYARSMSAEDKLGMTDAQGNRLYFDPERGWVQELSPLQQAISDRVQQEQLRQANEGAFRAEMSEKRMSDLGEDAAVRAKATGREFDRARLQDESSLADLIASVGTGARNQSQDRLMEGINRAMVRSGNTSNFADMMASRADNDAEAARQAAIEAQLTARGMVRSEYDNTREKASALQDEFTRRAAYTPTYSVNVPQTQGQKGSGQGSQNLFAAMQGSTPTQDYVQPNYGPANAAATIGSAIGGFGTYLQGRQDTNALIEALKQRGSIGG